MEKHFHPHSVEEKIYQLWEKNGVFQPKKEGKPFVIVMPPPNANGYLHIGHALFITLEDIMARLARMSGYRTLLLPGTDHAGIQTQVVFERHLAKEGKSRFDLGRDKFFQACYQFTQKQKKNILSQFKKMGASADWSREKFTLDPEISKVVLDTFVKFYEQGLIYRKERLINWCPRCQTVLSDLEVEHHQDKGYLYYIKYPLKDEEGALTIATTRPETMLADVAVAVHPEDKRYRQLVGKKLILPIAGREIPIISDQRVDKEFATGAVKITPAHDPLDWQIGEDHHLPWIQVIGFDDKMTKQAGEYAGLPKLVAREKIVSRLKKEGYLVKVEEIEHNVGHCERCKTVIEPMVSTQWWLKTKPLAKKALEVVEKGKIKFIPPRFKKLYLDWMRNLKDWCLSRQIWWGHRLPVYYCGKKALSPLQLEMNPQLKNEVEGCGRIIISSQPPKKCPYCGNTHLIHDPDTLDTWFSSSQWPFTTLGFDYQKPKEDFKIFYPTTVMETGYDILYLWVSRMIMMGLAVTGQVPFKIVYLHGLVRDEKGQKMSKSKGNVINPLETINEYGTDALRFALVAGVGQGESTSIGESKFKAGQYLTNKIWNASRFINLITSKINEEIPLFSSKKNTPKKYQEIWTDYQQFLTGYKKEINNFRYGQAADHLRQQFWHKFCDQDIESLKEAAYDGDLQTISLLTTLLANYLTLFHPFIPFVTEAIWQVFYQEKKYQKIFTQPLLAIQSYPFKVEFT